MKKLKTTALWGWLLTKRLYRKATFLLILLLIPALVLGYTAITANEDSGMFRILLTQEGNDPLANQIIADLQDSGQLLYMEVCESPEQAREQVRLGKADAAWIFMDDLQNRIENFLRHPYRSNAFITVVQQQDDAVLLLTREKLTGTVFAHLSRSIYLTALRSISPELAHVTDEELLAQYNATEISDNLFAFDEATGHAMEAHYLTTPLRGLLGITVVLCAVAAAMYYIRDTELGTFSWVSLHRRTWVELGCQAVAVFQVTAVATICLLIAGLGVSVGRELLILILYTLCCATFAMLLRQLCGSVRMLGTVLPVLVTAMLVICPVFMDFGNWRLWQYLLPPTYYINAAYNSRYLWMMGLYSAVCLSLSRLIALLPVRRTQA